MIDNRLRSEWLVETANAFQALIGILSGCLPIVDVQHIFERLSEPRSETERLIFRYFLSELLLDVLEFGRPIVQRDALESMLHAWLSIRRHPQPVAVLRQALVADRRRASELESVIARRVRDLLESRYAERLRLEDIADVARIRPSKVNRCFRLTYGSTVHQYLLLVRVRRGLDLVKQGTKIEAAALTVGFRSKKDFYRAVQRFVGCTPAQFRFRSFQDVDTEP
jgi:AraC-like DNA-binding protein